VNGISNGHILSRKFSSEYTYRFGELGVCGRLCYVKTGRQAIESELNSSQAQACDLLAPTGIFFYFYTVQENKIQSQTANYLH
jgi:hypothetical protein